MEVSSNGKGMIADKIASILSGRVGHDATGLAYIGSMNPGFAAGRAFKSLSRVCAYVSKAWHAVTQWRDVLEGLQDLISLMENSVQLHG